VAGSLNNIALVLRDRGQYPDAERLLNQAHAINVGTENVDWQGRNLNNLGLCMTMQYDGGKGRDLQEQAIERFRLAHSDWGIAMAKGDLGHAYRVLNQPDAARSALTESLSLRVGIRDLKGVAAALHGLGQLDLDEGGTAPGEDRLKPAMHLAMRIGDSGRIALLLQSFARIAAERGDHTASLRYLEAAAAYRRWNRSEDPPIVRDRVGALREAARNAGASAPDVADDHAVMNLADVALEALAGDTRSVDEILEAAAE
jgi:tetratricopeptide (TPR) repeat protein